MKDQEDKNDTFGFYWTKLSWCQDFKCSTVCYKRSYLRHLICHITSENARYSQSVV